jgi:hypothetical protein
MDSVFTVILALWPLLALASFCRRVNEETHQPKNQSTKKMDDGDDGWLITSVHSLRSYRSAFLSDFLYVNFNATNG